MAYDWLSYLLSTLQELYSEAQTAQNCSVLMYTSKQGNKFRMPFFSL